jgi:hypothetical protein
MLKESLAKAGLVPGPAEELVQDFEPTINLEVSFHGKPVDLGTPFRASECKVAPAIAFKPEVCHPCQEDCINSLRLPANSSRD